MTIYVDDLYRKVGRMKLCRLTADSEDELQDLARRLYLPQKWYHGDHYEVSVSARNLAIRLGAKSVTAYVTQNEAQALHR